MDAGIGKFIVLDVRPSSVLRATSGRGAASADATACEGRVCAKEGGCGTPGGTTGVTITTQEPSDAFPGLLDLCYGLGPFARTGPHCPILFQGWPAPGDEIVPSKEPVVKPVTTLNERVTMKLPVASANRPVPPVMERDFHDGKNGGIAVGVACPVKSRSACRRWPL